MLVTFLMFTVHNQTPIGSVVFALNLVLGLYINNITILTSHKMCIDESTKSAESIFQYVVRE